MGFYFIIIFVQVRYLCNIFNINQLTMLKKILSTFVGTLCIAIGSVSAQFSHPISVGAGVGTSFNLTDMGNV